MKVIEAMKKVKLNREKIVDLQRKISENSAHHSHETPAYPDPKKKVSEWSQSCVDLSADCVWLLTAISKSNHETPVSIAIGGKVVTKTVAEWIWRRREFAQVDRKTFLDMTDRDLKEGTIQTSTGNPMDVKIVRNYDPELREKHLTEFSEEPFLIDAALEVSNAVTDLNI